MTPDDIRKLADKFGTTGEVLRALADVADETIRSHPYPCHFAGCGICSALGRLSELTP